LTRGCIRTCSVRLRLAFVYSVYSIHSDELVTLTTVDPPVPVRIVGITHDHGLLRTIPERTGWSVRAQHGADDGYIDLQPDGNSFDIMMGLIKAKKGHP